MTLRPLIHYARPFGPVMPNNAAPAEVLAHPVGTYHAATAAERLANLTGRPVNVPTFRDSGPLARKV